MLPDLPPPPLLPHYSLTLPFFWAHKDEQRSQAKVGGTRLFRNRLAQSSLQSEPVRPVPGGSDHDGGPANRGACVQSD